MLNQRGKNVGYGEDPDDIRYARGTECVGISAAIEIFVMVPHGIENFRGDARRILQYVASRGGMGLDQRALALVQSPGLVEHGERDLCLADVVEHRGGV